MKEELLEIFDKQVKNLNVLKKTSYKERISKLKSIKKYIIEHRLDLHAAVKSDLRKPESEIDLFEIYPIISGINFISKRLKKWMKPQKVKTPYYLWGSVSKIYYEPKGVVLIISPWNLPFQLLLEFVIYAIASGNSIIIKPSEHALSTSNFVHKMFNKLFNDNEVVVIEGGVETSKELLNLPFNHVFFTGSAEIGKSVLSKTSKHLSSVTLELGGKNPCVIDKTANIEDASQKITYGKFTNSGQLCIAVDYICVHSSIENKLIQLLIKDIEKKYPCLEENASFPIINPHHFYRIKKLIDEALKKGAKVIYGNVLDEDKHTISPTILTNVTFDMKIMQEEIFGPILPIYSFNSIEDLFRIFQQHPKPLSNYIFSKNKNNIKKFLTHTSAGGSCINDTLAHAANPYLPFGGVNKSGIGKIHGFNTFREASNQRAVLKQKTGFTMLKLLYPPYTKGVKKIINYMIKFS